MNIQDYFNLKNNFYKIVRISLVLYNIKRAYKIILMKKVNMQDCLNFKNLFLIENVGKHNMVYTIYS